MVQAAGDASGLESLAFSYDGANRITHITNGMHPEATQTLSYDAMNRLLSDTASEFSSSYSYDADGNRKSQELDGVATSFTYASNSNWLLSSSGGTNATYGYNAEGDTKTINGHTAYTYDPFNRLAIADGESYLVSAQGQRLEKSGASGATYFAPDAGGTLLAEDQGGTWMDHVWLNGREVAVMAYGNVWPLHDDQTGRPLDLTNPSSHAVEWRVLGMPFNTALVGNSWGGNFNIGFPGQYFDSETGLYHNGARDYDPDIGRYIESDPIGLAGGVNTYVYTSDDPINMIDPLGLCDHKCNKFERGLAFGASAADKLSAATGKFSGLAGAGAVGAEILGGGPEDPVGDGAAAGLAGVAIGSGGVSDASSITAGLLRTGASGGDLRYTERAVLTTIVGNMVGALGDVGARGAGAALDSFVQSHFDSWKPLPPPCAGSP